MKILALHTVCVNAFVLAEVRFVKILKYAILFLVLLSVALLSSCSGKVYTSGDWRYQLTAEGAILTSYNYQSEELEIPETIDGHAVVGIGKELFYNADRELKRLVIPSSVKSIGNAAFSKCYALKDVVFEGEIYDIAPNAFDGTEWYNNKKDGIIYIGTYAYAAKGNFSNIKIKEGTTHVQLSGYWEADKITIPSSVIRINDYAFAKRGIKEIVFAQSDKSLEIGKYAFCNTNIQKLDTTNRTVLIEEGAFSSCISLTEIKISDNMTLIGESVFENCQGIEKVYINLSQGSLPTKTFFGCTGIKYIYISEGLEYIESRVFSYCPKLLEVYLPDSIKRISSNAFWDRERWNEPNIHIFGSEGSYAEIFAHNHKFVFVSDKESD